MLAGSRSLAPNQPTQTAMTKSGSSLTQPASPRRSDPFPAIDSAATIPRPVLDDRTLIRIRERSWLELLDLSLLVIRHRFWTIGSAAAVGIAPWAVLNHRLLADPEFPAALWPLLLVLEAPWATAPLTVVLGETLFGKPTTGRQTANRLLQSLPSLLLAQGLLRGLLTASGFLVWLIPWKLAFLNEIILLERLQGLQAFRRSARLRDPAAVMLAREAALIGFAILFTFCFWMGIEALISAMFRSELTWGQPEAIGLPGTWIQLGAWIAIGFLGVARFLIYLDHRIRREGWELALRLRELGRMLEEESP